MDKVFGDSRLYSNILMSSFYDKQISTMLYVAVVLSLVYYYINYKIKRRHLEKMLDEFDGPKGLPLLGNVFEFSSCPKEVLKNVLRIITIYKSTFKIWLLNRPYVFVHTPEDFQTVAFKVLAKDSSYRLTVEMLGDGLFVAEVEKWKRDRRIIGPVFSSITLLHSFLKIFNEQNVNLVNQLKKEVGTGKHFDLWPYISITSIMTICRGILGYEGTQDSTEILNFGNALVKSSELVSKRFYKPWLMPSFIFTIYRYILGHGDIFNSLRTLPFKMVKERRKLFQRMKTEGYVCTGEERTMQNFIDILLNLHENTGFTDQEIVDETLSVMFAGSETNALTSSFCLLMLAIRPDVQERIYEEVYSVFGDGNRLPDLEDLSKLPYLEQCIKETLRRFPIVPCIFRHAQEDIPISNGKIIPAGCNIVLNIIGVHHNRDVYPNPEVWDPSNFDPDKVANRHTGSFVPFSAGPRGCLGQKYGMVAMKALLSTIIRNFKMTTDVKMEDIEVRVDLIIRSITGYQVKLDYRHGKSIF
ncbi:cytochrome P450 4C1-like [Planococcus citri]|uniref:cytochrome P450 4C1-like n=1 Tax=Planococcus citri TaxID=170843 RepID=UPI0031F9E960